LNRKKSAEKCSDCTNLRTRFPVLEEGDHFSGELRQSCQRDCANHFSNETF
jgi:hypothetical protein